MECHLGPIKWDFAFEVLGETQGYLEEQWQPNPDPDCWLQNMFYPDLRNSSAENPRSLLQPRAFQDPIRVALFIPFALPAGGSLPWVHGSFYFGLDISALICLTIFGCQRQKLGAGRRIGAF